MCEDAELDGTLEEGADRLARFRRLREIAERYAAGGRFSGEDIQWLADLVSDLEDERDR